MAKAKTTALKRKPGGSAKSPSPRKSGPRAPSQGGLSVICSECYSDFTYYSSGNPARITCPNCMHVGNSAGKESMSKIAIAKTAEKGGLKLGIISAALFLLCGFTWIGMLVSAGSEPVAAGVHYGFLGFGAILFIVMVAMAFKYESNRYEIYF